ncbi:MAG: hypothetical protein D6732_29630 [Methanobacteriota archaeon]|nr:MAG: hypothetical protein D6732_29630 [Euryarchaeota archaeon]
MKRFFILFILISVFFVPVSGQEIQIIGKDEVSLQEPGLVSWEVIDNNLREYKIFMDGELVGKDFFERPADDSRSYNYNISIMIDVLGEFTLLLTVADYDGNVGEFATDVVATKLEPEPTPIPFWAMVFAMAAVVVLKRKINKSSLL